METGPGEAGIPLAQLVQYQPTARGAIRAGWKLLKERPGPLIGLSALFMLLSGIIVLNFIVMGGYYMGVVLLRRGVRVDTGVLFRYFDLAGPLIVLGLILTAISMAVMLPAFGIGFGAAFLAAGGVAGVQEPHGVLILVAGGFVATMGLFMPLVFLLNSVMVPAILLIVERRMEAIPALTEAWRITRGVRGSMTGFGLALFALLLPVYLIPLVGVALAICVYLPVLAGGYAYYWDAIRDR